MVLARDRHTGGCIYCGSNGPFSDEHVVSAGLGGDDAAWLLEDCVCRVCNTDIFSKLETKFLRSSPAALGRLFLQQRTRDAGSQTGVPSIQPNVTLYRDPNSGLLLAAEMGVKGKTTVLPQIVAIPREGAVETGITGSDHADVYDFLARFQSALTDDVILIEKRKDGFEVVYLTTTLTWTNESYAVGETTSSSRPPKVGLWLEPLVRPETASDGERLPFVVFGLPRGQLVCRANSPALAGALLTFLRQNPQVRQPSQVGAATESDPTPGVHLRFGTNPETDDRVLIKIGLNLVAKLLGVGFVRDEAFDRAVDYARAGAGAVYKAPPTTADVLGPAITDRHVMALLDGPGANGGHALVFVIRLYGGPLEAFRLAEFDGPIAGLETPIVIHVDYQNHRIERHDLEGHLLKVISEHGDWTMSAGTKHNASAR